METITVKEMQEFGSVYDAIELAKSKYRDYPQRPIKPKLCSNHIATQVKAYAAELENYEKLYDEYDIEKDKCREFNDSINSVIVAFICSEAELDMISYQYQDKVYSYAYEDGHSSGYYEVYLILKKLVDIFI